MHHHPPSNATPLVTAWFCILLVGGLLLYGVYMARNGGWVKLARRFRSDTMPTTLMTLTDVRIGLALYQQCVYVGLSDQGIHLRIQDRFAAKRPPLLIPWSAVRSHRRESRLKIIPWDLFEVQAETIVQVRLRLLIPDHYLARLGGPDDVSAVTVR